MKTLKLEIELVPSPVWYLSLCQLLRKNKKYKEWNAIKEEIFAKEGRKCYICGSKEGHLSAHEFWEYNDKKCIQRLVEIHHLCNLCYMVKHIEFWCYTPEGIEALKKQSLSRKDLIKYFCKVNNCTEKEFLKHEAKAFDVWERRSEHQWKQDFGKYKTYLKNIKNLIGYE